MTREQWERFWANGGILPESGYPDAWGIGFLVLLALFIAVLIYWNQR